MRKLLLLSFVLGTMAACAAPTASPIPTAYPPEYLPTVIALTADAANVLGTEVSLALTPTVLPSRTPRPTLSPTPRPTFTQTTIPGHDAAAIQILSPADQVMIDKNAAAFDTPVRDIEPKELTVQVEFEWPDGRERAITQVEYFVGNTSRVQAQASAAAPAAQQSYSTREFAALAARFSDAGGYFDTDNLISNEPSLLHPLNAIDAGFSRALATILDSNITTFIAAAILFYIGSGPVRGFAATFGIGIITTVFTAFTLTRLIVATWVRLRRPKVVPI